MRTIVLPADAPAAPLFPILVHQRGMPDRWTVQPEGEALTPAVMGVVDGQPCVHRLAEWQRGTREAICERDDVRFLLPRQKAAAPKYLPAPVEADFLRAVRARFPHWAALLGRASGIALAGDVAEVHFRSEEAIAAARLELPPAVQALSGALSDVLGRAVVVKVVYHREPDGGADPATERLVV